MDRYRIFSVIGLALVAVAIILEILPFSVALNFSDGTETYTEYYSYFSLTATAYTVFPLPVAVCSCVTAVLDLLYVFVRRPAIGIAACLVGLVATVVSFLALVIPLSGFVESLFEIIIFCCLLQALCFPSSGWARRHGRRPPTDASPGTEIQKKKTGLGFSGPVLSGDRGKETFFCAAPGEPRLIFFSAVTKTFPALLTQRKIFAIMIYAA